MSVFPGTLNTESYTQRVMKMTLRFAAIKDFYKWIIFLYIHWVVESVNIFVAVDFSFCRWTPLFRKKQEGFLLWWGFFQKSSTLITFPSVAGMERQSIDPQSTGIRMRLESATSHTSFTKVMMPRTSGGFLRPSPPPSVKINKITIKKFLVVTKAGFLIDSSERH